jgi:DDE superfamily endonuclease
MGRLSPLPRRSGSLAYCARSSLSAEVLTWLAGRLAHLLPPRPPGVGGNPPLALEVRLDAVAAVLLDGLSYRRAGRMVGISKTEVGDSMDLLLAGLGYGRPDGTFITALADLRERLGEMARTGEAVLVDGLATRCNDPVDGPTRRSGTTPNATCTPPRAWRCPPSMATFWSDGGWPGSCHEHELVTLSGLDEVLDASGVASLLDRGFRGMAKRREHWHAPVGDRRTKDRLSDRQRAYNRCQAGLRALVEQSIGHLANAWSLRRWRGRFYRVRDLYRAAGALVCLGRWLHRVPA